MRNKLIKSLTSLVTLSAMSVATAGTFTANFDNGQVPAGSAVYGNTVVETTGGFGGGGVLKLTKALNSQSGGFIIEDLDGGNPVYGFSAAFKVRVGGGTATPADGWSFNWADNLPDGTIGEEGAGSGLTVTFDIYDNGGGEAPSIDVKYAGTTLASTKFTIPQITTTNAFEDVTVNLHSSGLLDLTFKGAVIYTNLPVPGFVSIFGGRFGFGARTGGANENHFVDNLQINTVLTPAVGIVSQPASKRVMAGATAVFKVQVNNPDGVTYQWMRNGSAIAGATSDTLSLPGVSLADDGSKITVEVKGPGNTITSNEAVLSVVEVNVSGIAKLAEDFDDGLPPLDSALYGWAQVVPGIGVNGGGALLLTDANNDLGASFLINDLDAGLPVTGFTATFKMLVGGGSVPPADGFSFNFANDLPDDIFGEAENGAGTGLTVGFDIYDNGGGEAPSVDVKYGGAVIASTKVPLSLIETGDQYVPVIVQLKNDGTLDVVYNGTVLYYNLPIPGFVSITGGRFGWASRTGGLNENVFVDDIALSTTLVPGSLRITKAPVATAALIGSAATFTVAANLDAGVTYQWFRNGSSIAGATSASFTTPALTTADDQAKYKVTLTGPGNVVLTSSEVALSVVNLVAPANPKVTLNFNDGLLPVNSSLYGTGLIELSGGINDSGVLKLTTAENAQNTSFVMKPLDSGAEVASFTAAFKVRVGGGSAVPADGFSFNFASDFPEATVGDAENGAGTGVTVAFDIYDNGGGEAPSIDIKYGGSVIASNKYPISFIRTDDAFVEVLAQVNQDGTLDLAYNNQVVYHGLALPNFKPISNGKFAWAARTGGLNENMWVDDIRINTAKTVGPVRITQEPKSLVALQSTTASFSVQLSDPVGATYQWLKDGTPIGGATASTYSTAALTVADSGAKYSVRVTSQGGNITSQEAVLTVIPPIVATNPKASFNFDDGAVPAGTEVSGLAYVEGFDGVNGSGVLKLTINENGQQGSFIISDLDEGKPVSAFTATFQVRIGGGTLPPADGMAFVWANDVPAGANFGEDGTGSGLVVSFDIYDNGGGEAPALDIRYAGVEVATTKMPFSQIDTGDGFAPVAIRVENDGTLDLIYNNRIIYYNLKLPEFAPISGGSFAFGARTGGLNANQWVDNFALSTSTGGPAPKFTSIKQGSNGVVLEWTGGGTLQGAASVTGPWSAIANASSPFTAAPSDPQKFFRIVAP